MRRGLAGIEHGQRADAVRQRDEFGDRVHDSEHVGDVREGHDAGAFADEGCRGIQIQLTVLVHGNVPQDRPGAGRELLPGHEVGVVLDLGHDDLVTRGEREPRALGGAATERRVADRVRDEVQAGGRSAGPHELLGCRADEAGDRRAGVFEQLGRLGGERVRAAVHGGVLVREERDLGVDHGARLLAGRGGVEVHQRVTVDRAAQDREVFSEGAGVERDRGSRRGTHPSRLRRGAGRRVGV